MEGLVAQGIRAHGYELWCRGFESLLARKHSVLRTIQRYLEFRLKNVKNFNVLSHVRFTSIVTSPILGSVIYNKLNKK